MEDVTRRGEEEEEEEEAMRLMFDAYEPTEVRTLEFRTEAGAAVEVRVESASSGKPGALQSLSLIHI